MTENGTAPQVDNYPGHYGQYPCVAYPSKHSTTGLVDYRYFYVQLTEDPGYGSMHFAQIHRGAISFDVEPPASWGDVAVFKPRRV